MPQAPASQTGRRRGQAITSSSIASEPPREKRVVQPRREPNGAEPPRPVARATPERRVMTLLRDYNNIILINFARLYSHQVLYASG